MRFNIVASAATFLLSRTLAEPIALSLVTPAAQLNVCGGIQGTPCPEGQHCSYNGKPEPQYPDQQGQCVKDDCKPRTICVDKIEDCTTTTIFYGGCYDICTPTSIATPKCPLPAPTE